MHSKRMSSWLYWPMENYSVKFICVFWSLILWSTNFFFFSKLANYVQNSEQSLESVGCFCHRLQLIGYIKRPFYGHFQIIAINKIILPIYFQEQGLLGQKLLVSDVKHFSHSVRRDCFDSASSLPVCKAPFNVFEILEYSFKCCLTSALWCQCMPCLIRSGCFAGMST